VDAEADRPRLGLLHRARSLGASRQARGPVWRLARPPAPLAAETCNHVLRVRSAATMRLHVSRSRSARSASRAPAGSSAFRARCGCWWSGA
jgi:hypothetical protein